MRYRIRRKRQWPRIGVAGALTIAALVLAAGGAFVLDAVSSDPALEELARHAREAGQDPVEFATAAARRNRIVLLGDVPGLAAPKRIAADVIAEISRTHGLDAVVLEVSSDHQATIDRYLETEPENISILLAREGLVPEVGGSTQPYLRIFRRVWELNQRLGPDRRIRILAADIPAWPPDPSLSPAQAVRLYGQRDTHMAEQIEALLDRRPRSRLLVFAGGLHVLTGVQPRIGVGGGEPVSPEPLAAQLRSRYPWEVYSILMDGAPRSSAIGGVVAFTATGAYDLFRRHVDRGAFALQVDEHFDALGEPLQGASIAGVDLSFAPQDFELSAAADGYIFAAGAP